MKNRYNPFQALYKVLLTSDPEIAEIVQAVYLINIVIISPNLLPIYTLIPVVALALTALVAVIYELHRIKRVTNYLTGMIYLYLTILGIRHPELQCQGEYPLALVVSIWCIMRGVIEYNHYKELLRRCQKK